MFYQISGFARQYFRRAQLDIHAQAFEPTYYYQSNIRITLLMAMSSLISRFLLPFVDARHIPGAASTFIGSMLDFGHAMASVLILSPIPYQACASSASRGAGQRRENGRYRRILRKKLR